MYLLMLTRQELKMQIGCKVEKLRGELELKRA
jgi:hypothetical protein